MPSSPPTEALAALVCDCDKWMRPACEGLPFYKKHKGKQYCVLHYPDKGKSAAFNEALKRKLDAEDFDFRGVWFPDDVDFLGFTFTTPSYFNSATFSVGAYFSSAKFSARASFFAARFSAEAKFFDAKFSEDADFDFATFSTEADFDFATFSARASFDSATFSAEAYFRLTTFSAEAYFGGATFKDYVKFAGGDWKKVFGNTSSLSLQFARIEKPERLSFDTLTLRPHWLISVDARRFEFINVDWDWRNTDEEVESLNRNNVSSAHRMLAIACRNLAVNAEENHRYEEASRFRYIAMEARRLESLKNWRSVTSWVLGWLYWLASGYSERAGRAFVVLIGVWLVAAVLYTQVGFVRWEPRVSSEREAAEARRDEVGEPLRLQRALTYSLGVMTLQKPEPRPATSAAQALVMLETILGPVQAALLALAIRRKFMR